MIGAANSPTPCTIRSGSQSSAIVRSRVEHRGHGDLAERAREHVRGQVLGLQVARLGIAAEVFRVPLACSRPAATARRPAAVIVGCRVGAVAHSTSSPRRANACASGNQRDDVSERRGVLVTRIFTARRRRVRSRAADRGTAAARRGAGSVRGRPRLRTSNSGSSAASHSAYAGTGVRAVQREVRHVIALAVVVDQLIERGDVARQHGDSHTPSTTSCSGDASSAMRARSASESGP